jgi:DNA-directed RNA polymerase subunit RPC12/RpoP
MDEVTTKRNTWVACPKCGHKVAKVRTCDMEVKCKHCGHEFEAVIGSSRLKKTEAPEE